MSEPFLSEIRIMSFNFPPSGWALCNGQLLPINQNQPLFALLGTTYGGDGIQNFALPNLQGRVPVHRGASLTEGQSGGEETHILTISEQPAHTHTAVGTPTASDSPIPTGNYLGAANNAYAPAAALTQLQSSTIANNVGGQEHDNMQPYLVLSFCIALQGIFPSQT